MKSTAPTFSTFAWLAAGMAMASIPFIGRLPIWVLFLAVGVGGWRLWLAWHGHPAPPRPWRMGLSAAVLIILLATRSIGAGIDAAAPLFVAFLWIKLLEIDNERDVLVSCFFAFFLICGVLLTGQTLAQTLWALGSTVLILTALMWYHSPHLDTLRGPPAVRWAVRHSLALLLQAMPLAIVLFMFVPRPAIQLPSLPGGEAKSGVSEVLNPGDFAKNWKDEKVAFRVEFPNRDQPPVDDLYWRGLVLWTTDGNQWRRGTDSPLATPFLRTTHTAQGRTLTQDITLLSNPDPWLYTLDCPILAVEQVDVHPGLVQQWRDGPAGTATYRVHSNLSARDRILDRRTLGWSLDLPWTPDRTRVLLDPRILALAQQLGQGARTANEVAERAIAWFSRSGFLYTTEPGVMGANATATFLFDKRQGFCAHFASAFAVLMRAAGVPARVVVGYHGGEFNAAGGFLTVRQANAHAWAEVWTGSDETGWRRVDLTTVVPSTDPQTGRPTTAATAATSPAARTAARATRPWYEKAGFRARVSWEYLESKWDRFGVGFNSEAQEEFLTWLGLEDFGIWASGIGLVLGGVLVLVGIALGMVFLPRFRAWRDLTPEARWYARFERRLAGLGVPREPVEGPLDYADRAADRLPARAEDIRTAAQAWVNLRYGAVPADADRDRLAAAVQRLESAAHQRR